jgi:ketosteroid isomerase-like protein
VTELTVKRVLAAYDALGSGDRSRLLEFWSPDLRFEIPGCHAHAGWYEDLDGFLGFAATIGRLSGGTYTSENVTVLVNPEEGYSVDVNVNKALRANAPAGSTSPYDRLDIESLHLLRWRDGRIVEGRWVLIGDALATSALWWSPRAEDGSRNAVS